MLYVYNLTDDLVGIGDGIGTRQMGMSRLELRFHLELDRGIKGIKIDMVVQDDAH